MEVENSSDSNQTFGSADLASNFTINGYWDYPLTAADSRDLQTPVTGGVQFQFPEVGPIAAYPFVPGVYTLAVVDEWGDSVVLHFTVVSGTSGGASSVTSAIGAPINIPGIRRPTSPWEGRSA
jgi:hypothetical protein